MEYGGSMQPPNGNMMVHTYIHIIVYICIYIYMCANMYKYVHTSSTAQGGGGSFKDRKPIGEVGCCDAWMAEQIH